MLRLSRIRCIRLFSTTITRPKFSPGTTLKESDIDEFFDQPKWSVQELLSSKEGVHIPRDTIKKILKVSGLNQNINDQQEESIRKALEQQMMFVRHLYESQDQESQNESSNKDVFRLIRSDHVPDEPLTLKKLLKEIEELQVDEEKGELGFRKGFFTIPTKP